MTASRDIGDFTTDPDGGGGQAWTTRARQSIQSLWGLSGGLLTNVSGTNALTADVEVSAGFSAYGNGQLFALKATATNTGAMTLALRDSGGTLLDAKALVAPSGDALGAGAVVLGTTYLLQFLQADDEFRLITSTGVSNVTVTGGIHLHRSLPTRLAAKINNTTSQSQIVSRSHAAAYSTSRVVIEGALNRLTAAGTSSDAGFTIALFVDGVSEETITDAEIGGGFQTGAFAFEYEPGDTDAHTYSVRATSTLGAAYYAGTSFMVLSELSPNA